MGHGPLPASGPEMGGSVKSRYIGRVTPEQERIWKLREKLGWLRDARKRAHLEAQIRRLSRVALAGSGQVGQ